MTKARDLAGFASSSVTTTASDGLVLKGDGSTTDVIIKNGANATVASIPDGSTNLSVTGSVTGALARGAIQVGDSSGVSSALTAGGASTVLTSDGTDLSWVAAASSYRTLISTTTINNNATVLVEGLDNSYDHYQFVITDLLIASSTAYTCYMRFKSGGSIDTTAGNYRFANIKAHSTSTSATVKQSSTYSTQIDITTATDDAAPDAALIIIDIFDPAGTTNSTKGFGTAIGGVSGVAYTMRHTFLYEPVGVSGSNRAVTGVQFYASVGNVASGTIKLYGIS